MQYSLWVSPYVFPHYFLKKVASTEKGMLSQCYPRSHCVGFHGTTVSDTPRVSILISSFQARRCRGLHGALDGVQHLFDALEGIPIG